MRIIALPLALELLFACTPQAPPPQGELILVIDTDAPLPPSAGRAMTFGETPGLFDQLRVDVMKPGETSACAQCSRTFAVDALALARGKISLGIPQTPTVTGYRARVRLYASRTTVTGLVPENTPDGRPPQSVIDFVVNLPPVGETGLAYYTVFLPIESVGLPIADPVSPIAGSIISGKKWDGADTIPCAGEPALDEVCVPGGAFWMGNPHSIGTGLGNRTERSRLVVVSPFYMLRTEVTVAEIRAFGKQNVIAWSGETTGDHFADFCTYTDEPGESEHRPVNCILWDDARTYCQARGMDLPTEAQLEYATSNMRGQLYVWGDDRPKCEDAVLGRGGIGLFAGLLAPCTTTTTPLGPDVVGFLATPLRRDRFWTGAGTIYDLEGNVGEYALDEFQQEDAPCWRSGGVFRDPSCKTGVRVHTVRGGDWTVVGNLAYASSRFGQGPTDPSVTVGFRCARPGL